MGRRARPKELLALDTPAPARVDGPGRGRNLRRQRTALPRGHSESCPGAAGGGRFLSKQTRLASEALAGESGSLDLLNVDEEAGESLETDQQPRILAIIPATGLFRHLPTNVPKSAGRVSVGASFGGIIRES